MIKKCFVCHTEFKTYPSKVKTGRGKYCSKSCSDLVTLIKPGQHIGIETQIKKGDKLALGNRGLGCWNYKGRIINDQGYVLVHTPNHPHADKDGNVREHRLVMEKSIGRYLTKIEVVHHINEIRDDNRIENLMLFATNTDHLNYHRNILNQDAVIFDGAEEVMPNARRD